MTKTYTAAHTVTQAEIDSGLAITRTVMVKARAGRHTRSRTATVSTPVAQRPSVSIALTVASVGATGNSAANQAGEVITYQIVVTNDGNVTLTDVRVTDPTLNVTLGTPFPLEVDATVTLPAAQTVTQAQIDSVLPIEKMVAVTACAPDKQTLSQTATANTDINQSPGVSIVKSATSVGSVGDNATTIQIGEVINYEIVVSNTGNVTLTDVVVTDRTLKINLGAVSSLPVRASATLFATQTVTADQFDSGAIRNTAAVTCGNSPTLSQTTTVTTVVPVPVPERQRMTARALAHLTDIAGEIEKAREASTDREALRQWNFVAGKAQDFIRELTDEQAEAAAEAQAATPSGGTPQ